MRQKKEARRNREKNKTLESYLVLTRLVEVGVSLSNSVVAVSELPSVFVCHVWESTDS